MSSVDPGSGAGVWAIRRARAVDLLREAPHASEILRFYLELTETQERVAEGVPVDDWLELIPSTTDAGPLFRIEGLVAEAASGLFRDFLEEMAGAGTEIIAAGARVLLQADPEKSQAVLTSREGFHARAFLEPVLTTLAAAISHSGEGGSSHCFKCGSLPVVGLLRDVPEALGARSLACPLCATEWRIDRLMCANCGEAGGDVLFVHTADRASHVRVEECRSCGSYIKTVDLRRRGDAVPVVDELATVELDLWARERGLRKLQKNVLEL